MEISGTVVAKSFRTPSYNFLTSNKLLNARVAGVFGEYLQVVHIYMYIEKEIFEDSNDMLFAHNNGHY